MKKRFLLTGVLICAVFGLYSFNVDESSVALQTQECRCPRGYTQTALTGWLFYEVVDENCDRQKMVYECSKTGELSTLMDCYRLICVE